MIRRKPTPEEVQSAWKHLAFEINLHRHITMNHASVVACLDRIDRWVGAHGDHNGERPERDINKNINDAFWLHIAKIEPPARPEKPKLGRPKKIKPDDAAK